MFVFVRSQTVQSAVAVAVPREVGFMRCLVAFRKYLVRVNCGRAPRGRRARK